jgi:hypothetical protein
MMRCRTGLHTNEARRHFLEERQDVATLQLTAEDHLAIGVNADMCSAVAHVRFGPIADIRLCSTHVCV